MMRESVCEEFLKTMSQEIFLNKMTDKSKFKSLVVKLNSRENSAFHENTMQRHF